jgi:hypothetical protein
VNAGIECDTKRAAAFAYLKYPSEQQFPYFTPRSSSKPSTSANQRRQINMEPSENIVSFFSLPFEVRAKIWTEVLTSGSVWFFRRAFNRSDDGEEEQTKPIYLRLTSRYTSPHLAGQTCRESRNLMKDIYRHPFRGLGDTVYWIHEESAVFAFETKEIFDFAVKNCPAKEAHRLHQ